MNNVIYLPTPKDPNSVETFNWRTTPMLAAGDSVVSVEKIFVARGDASLNLLSQPAVSPDGQIVSARIGGGRLGARYRVTIRFTTATSEKLDMSLEFDCAAA